VRLTSLSHGAGCGCKIGPAQLGPILAGLPVVSDPRVLTSAAGSEDAGVVRLTGEIALIHTADFFTPIVDDPYWFGRIAAANALSDVYAMGGEPLSALNLVAWPDDRLELLGEVLRGGLDACAEAGCAVVGGHTIDDPEPKFGLAVTGTVHPDALLRNSGGSPGDALVLTKPLGAGAAATALKRDGTVSEAAVEVMAALNADASRAARAAGAHALTDVTGFGLLGHLHELAAASGCAAEIVAADVPVIDGVEPLLGVMVAGGARRNREHAETFTAWDGVDEPRRWLLCDPMTSGGLLAAVPPGASMPGWPVGRLVDGEPGRLTVHM
jgi:selenide,water dikinase